MRVTATPFPIGGTFKASMARKELNELNLAPLRTNGANEEK